MNFFDIRFFIYYSLACLLLGCSKKNAERAPETLFNALPSDSTGINFTNKLSFDQAFNIYTYRNFYNGGGVGLGDINNDGLIDIYLVANQSSNKLYLNKGGFHFDDITEKSRTEGAKAWSTGVSMADVNGDGWLDIYVCNSGDVKGDNKENELFINNHDLTFTESAKEYGIADKGFTTHAIFFDYDRDNDLDLYVLNNSYQAIGSFNLRKNERPKRDLLGGDKLMRNDNGHFVDVSESAGIFGSVIGFGLGATVGDINNDGWPDIYVSNDFFERDYLYLNNKNGTFKECLPEQMKSISGASMGADLADINNDALPDIFVTEMLPETNARIKTVTTFESWDRYQNAVSNDYYHQFTRNMLQLNNGNNTFSEIGRMTGMEATDWSWGALMFDVDNDGWKDVFVANGIYQDLTNQDYLQYVSSEEVVKSIVSNDKVNYKKLVELIPSRPVSDFLFQNQGNLHFVNKAEEWGIGDPNFSNGSAYGDLDNDGDLDLVVNRVNEKSSIIRNESIQLNKQNCYLKFELKGIGKNIHAIGTKITLKKGAQQFYIEQMPNRGFESSVDPRPNIGLGKIDTVDFIKVEWPNGMETILKSIATNQTLVINQKEADVKNSFIANGSTQLFEILSPSPINYSHTENQFVDFDRDRLTYQMISTTGPPMSVADVNGDGLQDLFIGGAKDQSASLFIQKIDGYQLSKQPSFEADKVSEDVASLFFDSDNDGDLDLYVCSGGAELPPSSSALADRLYFNDGRGNFSKSDQLLPTNDFISTSTVNASDFDKDGDLDLFVGARLRSFSYGYPVSGYMLVNDGHGKFIDKSSSIAPGFEKLGMITDASWSDIDNDNDDDLLVVGEWMAIKVFFNENGKFTEHKDSNLSKATGWWNRIVSADIDKDGDIDFLVANHGFNSRFKASIDKPLTMWVSDFDQNGSVEQIMCAYNGDKDYPIVLRHDLLSQIPSLKKKFLKYEDYKNATIADIFTPEQLKLALKLEATNLASSILINDGKGNFKIEQLPLEAQLSPVYAILADDVDKDGKLDLLLGGNLYGVKPEAGRYDASYGAFLKGDGKGKFKSVPNQSCGLILDGEVRDIKRIAFGNRSILIVARNNSTPIFLKVNE
jgi:enediyne biosynthesis protein E4